MNNRFTLYYAISSMASDYIESEKKKNGSIIGNLMKNIERKGRLRDAQRTAVQIYLWLKEVGNNSKLSDLIKSGKVFNNVTTNLFYPGESIYLDKPILRYLNRYFQDMNVKNKDKLLGLNLTEDELSSVIENLFEDFKYPNYLFSLPMGAGKTFLMATFIYIDLYMYSKTKDDRYSSNFIIIAPSARKTAIIPALKTIKLFNPRWVLPNADADRLKKNIKIEILDEISNADKLQNQNPNLVKIIRTTNGHPNGNVFILNAEKVIPNNDCSEEEYENLSLGQKTRIKRSNEIKEALANLNNVEVFLDEAHHTYSSDTETKKLRQQLDIINANNNIKCCIGMSGTPYVNRNIQYSNKKIKIQDIQDIVYFYPLPNAIHNFLKEPCIKKVDGNTELLIKEALTDFFTNYDIEYSNGTKSKIAFYCPSIDKLNEEILPIIIEWYEENGRDKKEILKYYSDESNDKYPIPKENRIHFLNLDNPSSKYRLILLVQIGTEGWDCKSLTSVVLPRQKTSKNFVLQTTCRCLREVDCAKYEKALIYLDSANYNTLDEELNTNYHLHINDLENLEKDYKDYPVYKIKEDIGNIVYNNVYEKYIESPVEKNINIAKLLNKYSLDSFKSKYPFSNQIGITTISENGLNERITYKQIENEDYKYSFVDFIYELEESSFGNLSCSKLMKYEKELKKIYKQIMIDDNINWIINHPNISTYDVCKDITSIFAHKVICQKEYIEVPVKLNLLNWNMDVKPTIRVYLKDIDKLLPENSYMDIQSPEFYDENLAEIKYRYENKMKYANKEKSFNYLPYKMDSSFEKNLLLKALGNINDLDIEIYYNGYKNNDLESLKIDTPYGKYTPDFLVIKRDSKKKNIEKVLLIETKGDPFETKAKELYVKNVFLKHNDNFTYIKIRNVKDDVNEYNKLTHALIDFANN